MYRVPIEQGKIREFAKATGADQLVYGDASAAVPPTFLTSAALHWEPSDQNPFHELGFDLTRLLHGEEEYVFHGPPPHAGDVLTVSTRIGDRYEKPGKRGGLMRFGVIIREFRDDAGQLVAEQITTLVETGGAGR